MLLIYILTDVFLDHVMLNPAGLQKENHVSVLGWISVLVSYAEMRYPDSAGAYQVIPLAVAMLRGRLCRGTG